MLKKHLLLIISPFLLPSCADINLDTTLDATITVTGVEEEAAEDGPGGCVHNSDAKIVYENNFSDAGDDADMYPSDPSYRNPNPVHTGSGTGCADADINAPFNYAPMVKDLGSGHKGLRFPTQTEQGGADNSMFVPGVFISDPSLQEPRLIFETKGRLPLVYDHSVPSYYYEHRYLFVLATTTDTNCFNTNAIEHWGDCTVPATLKFYVKFKSNHELSIYLAGSEVGVLDVGSDLPGGADWTLTVDATLSTNGNIAVTFESGAQSDSATVNWGSNFEHIYTATMNAAGNSIASGDDLDKFSYLTGLKVRKP